MKFSPAPLFGLVVCAFLASCQHTTHSPRPVRAEVTRSDLASTEASGRKYAISTQGKVSTQAAEAMFEKGGNLIDAFVAASFTLAVERPQSTGISGGGFLIFFEAEKQQTHAVDFRERAPARATKNMFLDRSGKPDSRLSQDSILAAGVPGFVAGLFEVHQKFGKLPWAVVLEPSIELAEKGFPVYPNLAKALRARTPVLKTDPSARAVFLNEKGEAWPEGHWLVQKDLARSLRLIAQGGKKGFYEGPIRKAFVEMSRKHRGRLSDKDFENVRVVWREPVQGEFQGHRVVSMPPPSSGGVHVIQFLNFFEQEDLKALKPLSTDAIHLAAASLQQSFADRAVYLGDPDFVQVPTAELISKQYSKARRAEISRNSARASSAVKAGSVEESTETTHLSIIDADGNAIASTQTINGWMGAGLVVPGTGIVLNNEMDDFTAAPGASNLFGAVGGEANSVAPGKTPLSSMSPTLLFKDGKAVLSVGAPGGTRIISCVAQTILNYTGYRMSLSDAVGAVRYHHQWQPDILFLDPPGPGERVVQELKERGHQVKLEMVPCNVMAVSREGSLLRAVADPRDIGTGAAR